MQPFRFTAALLTMLIVSGGGIYLISTDRPQQAIFGVLLGIFVILTQILVHLMEAKNSINHEMRRDS